jgi:hypothetical protein
MAVRAEENEVVEAVVSPVAIDVVQFERKRATAPSDQAALVTPRLLQAILE